MSDFDIGAEIMKELKSYSNEVAENVNKVTRKSAGKLRKELSETSPKRDTSGKHYSEGWKTTQTEKEQAISEFTVYNAKKPGLTHLLENGHAISGGTQRVKPIPHIAPAEEKVVDEFMNEVKKAVKEAGK